MLLLSVLGMLEVLKELVVFVGEIFKRVNPQTFLRGNYRIKKNGAKKTKKSLSQCQKTTFTLESYIAFFPFDFFKVFSQFEFLRFITI